MSGDGLPIQKKWERGLCELDSPSRIQPKPPHHCSPMTPSFCYLNHPARLESSLVTVLPVSHPVLSSLALPHPQNRSEYKDQNGLYYCFLLAAVFHKRLILPFPDLLSLIRTLTEISSPPKLIIPGINWIQFNAPSSNSDHHNSKDWCQSDAFQLKTWK